MKKLILVLVSLSFAIICVQEQALAKNYNTVTNLSQVQFQGKMALETFSEIEKATEGRVKLVWHDAGDLIPVNMHINAVSTGSVPVAFTAFAYFGGTLPIANIYSGFPFDPGMEAWHNWLFMGDGLKILQETLDKLNIVAIPVMATPSEGGGFFNRELTSPDDFKGLRFRIGGWGGEVVSRLGAAVSQIPATELYMAMERGRIDAMEFSAPTIDVSWGFEKLAKIYYFPGWHQPVGMQWVLINRKVWDGWSKEDQARIMEIGRKNFLANYYAMKVMDVDTIVALQAAPIQVQRFPQPVLEALHKAWQGVLADGMAKYPEVKKAYESFMAHTARGSELNELQSMPDIEGW